ncbi:CDP-diacylglycerol--glycerol-3-phosphate 3-phosphatidyltransferase [Candidatus Saccharibacteria bacterium]|nr:CDP-diacylglycerol--glycerol-3-phosphate 3-phosphatidyltransferase [Candidatus Saccharibacteria bacterium]
MKKSTLNGPTILTIVRIVLVAPLMISIFMDSVPAKIVAIVCFAVASLTDFVDGKWARKRGLVTELGKFLDPLADKMLVNLTFLALVVLGQVPVWVFGIILMRDFIVDGLRMLAASRKVTIAASKFGKLKTLTQMVTIILIMVNMIVENEALGVVNDILLYIVVALTVYSGADYLVHGRKLVL